MRRPDRPLGNQLRLLGRVHAEGEAAGMPRGGNGELADIGFVHLGLDDDLGDIAENHQRHADPGGELGIVEAPFLMGLSEPAFHDWLADPDLLAPAASCERDVGGPGHARPPLAPVGQRPGRQLIQPPRAGRDSQPATGAGAGAVAPLRVVIAIPRIHQKSLTLTLCHSRVVRGGSVPWEEPTSSLMTISSARA